MCFFCRAVFIYFHTNGFLSLNKHTLSCTADFLSLGERKKEEERENGKACLASNKDNAHLN